MECGRSVELDLTRQASLVEFADRIERGRCGINGCVSPVKVRRAEAEPLDEHLGRQIHALDVIEKLVGTKQSPVGGKIVIGPENRLPLLGKIDVRQDDRDVFLLVAIALVDGEARRTSRASFGRREPSRGKAPRRVATQVP